MARISTYALDTNITPGDKWIGTDGPTLATKNFSVQKIIDYLNSSGYLDSVASKFFYQTLDPGEDRANGSISFVPQVGASVPFSSISGFRISQLQKSGVNVSDLYDDYIGSRIMIQRANDPSRFGIYDWLTSTQNVTEPTFYDITMTYVFGNGSMEEDEDYLVSLLEYDISESADKNYVHNQNVASAVWTVNHNLDKYASVSVVDSGYTAVNGLVEYINTNSLTITFSAPFSGKAFIN